jgi:hypothetical protein
VTYATSHFRRYAAGPPRPSPKGDNRAGEDARLLPEPADVRGMLLAVGTAAARGPGDYRVVNLGTLSGDACYRCCARCRFWDWCRCGSASGNCPWWPSWRWAPRSRSTSTPVPASARSTRLTRWQRIRHVVLTGALPQVLVGLGLGVAWFVADRGRASQRRRRTRPDDHAGARLPAHRRDRAGTRGVRAARAWPPTGWCVASSGGRWH